MKKEYTNTALNSIEIAPSENGAPEWVQLVPEGDVIGRDGRKWKNDKAENILQSFTQLGRDLPIDMEHATEHKGPKGEPAPAYGWITALENRAGEIWGKAEWTTDGKAVVENRAYRYLSPVIIYEQGSGSIVGITSVALTNNPNFRMSALNQQQAGGQPAEEEVMLKALLAALALPENATEEQALAKITILKTDLASATNRAENPSLEKFVPRGDYDAALTRATNAEQALADIKKDGLEKEVDTALNQALTDGKITPATKEYHKAQCMQDGGLERFKAFCSAAPVIGDASGLDNKTPEGKAKALNAEQQQIAEMFGNSAEDLAKYGN